MLNAETILPLLEDTENERTERTISTDAKEKFGQAISTEKPGLKISPLRQTTETRLSPVS